MAGKRESSGRGGERGETGGERGGRGGERGGRVSGHIEPWGLLKDFGFYSE